MCKSKRQSCVVEARASQASAGRCPTAHVLVPQNARILAFACPLFDSACLHVHLNAHVPQHAHTYGDIHIPSDSQAQQLAFGCPLLR